MSNVEFQYKGINTIIQCNENEKMKEICQRYANKVQLDKNNIFFIYDGKSGKDFNEELTFIEMANLIDKEQKKMTILVNNINEINEGKNLIKSKIVICPKCLENIKMKINNYKITLFDCKNGHQINNLTLNEFVKTQYINLSNIVCGQCKEINKNDSFNNEFYKCYECNINLCPLCKLNHDKNHNIINDYKINYICQKHNEIFSKYCNKCKINICGLCEDEHIEHDCIYLIKIIKKKEDLEKKLNELRKYIDIFNKEINTLIEILNNLKENYEKYYEIEKNMINNYNIKNRNYEILFNLNEITNINDFIIKDINEINNKDNIEEKFNEIIKIYNNFNKNEIKLTLKIEKEDINKDIYFLDNSDDEIYINGKFEEHHHDLLKELNETNVELFINNKKYKYKKFFRPEIEGIYLIVIKLKTNIKDCTGMFYNCRNLINIDLSSFDSKNVTRMGNMFRFCYNLKNIDLSFFDIKNVTDLNCMFQNCENLININLSSFCSKNIIDMNNMFC